VKTSSNYIMNQCNKALADKTMDQNG